MTDDKFTALEKQIKWTKKHLRIVFLISSLALLMISGHFVLHYTGNLPH